MIKLKKIISKRVDKKLLSDKTKEELKRFFEGLIEPVTLILDKDNSALSQNTQDLLVDISNLSEKISFKLNSLDCLDKPCIAINSNKDFGIRYMGIPSGGEFQVFIETIKMVSTNSYDLSQRTLEILEMLDKPVDIKVFITKSCGWCPLMLKKMYSFALASDYIKTHAVDCSDFKELAIKYNVLTVPKVIINDKVEFVGFKDENEILGNIMYAGM